MNESKFTNPKARSISDIDRLKHLGEARLCASGVDCVLNSVDFSGNSLEIIDSEYIDASITEDQMRGIFLVADIAKARLRKIGEIISEYASHEEEYSEIASMIDDAVLIIDAGRRVAGIHFSRKIHEDSRYSGRIHLNSIWVSGFFSILNFANERVFLLFEKINDIYSRLEEVVRPEGGGDAENPLH